MISQFCQEECPRVIFHRDILSRKSASKSVVSGQILDFKVLSTAQGHLRTRSVSQSVSSCVTSLEQIQWQDRNCDDVTQPRSATPPVPSTVFNCLVTKDYCLLFYLLVLQTEILKGPFDGKKSCDKTTKEKKV